MFCCYLHNYLRRDKSGTDICQGLIHTAYSETGKKKIRGVLEDKLQLINLQNGKNINSTDHAKQTKDTQCEYLTMKGTFHGKIGFSFIISCL